MVLPRVPSCTVLCLVPYRLPVYVREAQLSKVGVEAGIERGGLIIVVVGWGDDLSVAPKRISRSSPRA